MNVEIRCGAKKHGELDGEGHFLVVCKSVFCGSKPGVIIIHKFDAKSGELMDTNRYKEIGGRHDS